MDFRFLRNVLLKTLALFLVLNALFALADPLPVLGRLSAYNHLFPGRPRLPFGERPQEAYNLSLLNLEAMFASHELSGTPKREKEFRVLLLGDSAVWGFLLENEDTLAERLNQAGLQTAGGKQVVFYNLGYPTISLTKDLLLLDDAMRFDPDLVVWLVTLEAFPRQKQLFTPLVQRNPQAVRELISAFGLLSSPTDLAFELPGLIDRTIAGRRRELADLLRYQLYGVMWAATGIDQAIPESFDPPAEDLSAEQMYYGLSPPTLKEGDLAFEVLEAGFARAGGVPVLLVNEPIYISQGENSHLRYNFFYPRWIYDRYRELLRQKAQDEGWPYLDLWDRVPKAEFTNSAIHLTPAGTRILAEEISMRVLEMAGRVP